MLGGMMQDMRNFLSLPGGEKRAKVMEAVDNRIKIITAGLSMKELRALMRGDAPTEKPNPRYKVHVTSFLFHIRPKYYYKASTIFTHTFRLGYLSAFFFLVEIITGLILMIYYVPSPHEAYQSILNLESNVMFGKLMRDMHRLGAEAMVAFVWLHLFRTYFTGSYKGERTFTWLTGVLLLILTIFLSFSGYLLPWDQLAYWAVTIGTSMADKAPPPVVGNISNLLIRGAPDIGAGALLRFYLAHVILLPLAGLWFLSVHYYKVSREHGISLPAVYEEGGLPPEKVKEGKTRIDFIPDLLNHEIFLASVATGLLLIVLLFRIYPGAPLEHHANPLQTPLDTEAPWYFLWIQGMLKLGDPTWMGVIIPTIFVIVLFAIPYLDRNPKRMARNRPFAIFYGIFWAVALVVLTYMGTPGYGIETPPATRIIQDLAPEEGMGELRAIPYDELVPGVYYIGDDTSQMPPDLAKVFQEFSERVEDAEARGKFKDATGMFYISEWQANLKKVIVRIEWTDVKTQAPTEYAKVFYLHEDRPRDE